MEWGTWPSNQKSESRSWQEKQLFISPLRTLNVGCRSKDSHDNRKFKRSEVYSKTEKCDLKWPLLGGTTINTFKTRSQAVNRVPTVSLCCYKMAHLLKRNADDYSDFSAKFHFYQNNDFLFVVLESFMTIDNQSKNKEHKIIWTEFGTICSMIASPRKNFIFEKFHRFWNVDFNLEKWLKITKNFSFYRQLNPNSPKMQKF